MKVIWHKRHYKREELDAHCADCGEILISESWEEAWYHVKVLRCRCGVLKEQRSG